MSTQNFDFRPLAPVELWSATLSGSFTRDDLTDAVTKMVTSEQQRYSGFINTETNGTNISYTRTRYPRQKYGITPIPQCQEGMETLAMILDSKVTPDPQQIGFRVVLGLSEGYGNHSKVHDMQYVAANLGRLANVQSAEILAATPSNQGVEIYTEPVAVIQGGGWILATVHELADKLKQERFTIENLGARRAWVVETPHCTRPD